MILVHSIQIAACIFSANDVVERELAPPVVIFSKCDLEA